tara:strand:+ start:32652 stop:32927 length:276 start_codon:yes stop_codon:yes gene_type:complete
MKTIIIVQNMLCGGCVNLINSRLSEIKNITNVEVDMYSSEIMFDYFHETDLCQAKRKLKALGYPEFNDNTSLFTKIKSLVNCAINKLSINP